MADLTAGALRLLGAARRRLYRERAAQALAAAAWIVAAIACGAAAIHLLYRALGPAAVAAPAAIVMAAALAYTLIRAPSGLEAAAFVDDALGGRFAYRTLLELTGPTPRRGRPDPVAAAAFLQWLAAHALRAEPQLRARAPVPWPRAALACAAAALLLAALLLQLPGAAPRGPSVVGSGGAASSFAHEAAPPASRAADRPRGDGAGQTERAVAARGAASARTGPRSPATQPADAGAATSRQGAHPNAGATGVAATAAPAADAGGLQAGTARDARVAAQLAQAVRLGDLERTALRPNLGGAASRRSGGELQADASPRGSPPRGGSPAAAALPPSELGAASTGPVAQVLIRRYFARLGREAPARAGDRP
jgi:hypothetical protein